MGLLLFPPDTGGAGALSLSPPLGLPSPEQQPVLVSLVVWHGGFRPGFGVRQTRVWVQVLPVTSNCGTVGQVTNISVFLFPYL